MNQITEPEVREVENAHGRTLKVRFCSFEITQDDVRKEKPHYLGHHHTTYTFRSSDVGRIIIEQSDGTGWSCWYFANYPPKEA